MAGDKATIEFFADFRCPYSYETSRWLREVRDQKGTDRLTIHWRLFSLAELNQQAGPDRHAWDHPDDPAVGGLASFKGAYAARQQGADAWDRYHLALFDQRHQHVKDLNDPATARAAAEVAGLDLDRFEADVQSPAALSAGRGSYRRRRAIQGTDEPHPGYSGRRGRLREADAPTAR